VQELVHSHRRERLIGLKHEAAVAQQSRRRRSPVEKKPATPAREPRPTMLAVFTLVWVGVYLPIEVYSSWLAGGLLRFTFLIDLIGIVLLAAGGLSGWRAARMASGWLTAGWAWTGANFWRGTMERFAAANEGRALFFGEAELWLGPVLTAIAMAATAAALFLPRQYATR
jgi:hypothetical protein